jgi:hypothetical protein
LPSRMENWPEASAFGSGFETGSKLAGPYGSTAALGGLSKTFPMTDFTSSEGRRLDDRCRFRDLSRQADGVKGLAWLPDEIRKVSEARASYRRSYRVNGATVSQSVTDHRGSRRRAESRG